MSREMPDRVPRYLHGMTPLALKTFQKNAGDVDPNDYFKSDMRSIGYSLKSTYDYKKYFEGRGLDMDRLSISVFGVGHLKSANTGWHFSRCISPLAEKTELNDFIDFPFPEFDEQSELEIITEKVKALHKRDLAALGYLAQTFYETAWQIRGLENFLMDMYVNPDIINCLLDRLLELRIKNAEVFAKAGVDAIFTGDDVSMQNGMIFDPALWRQYFKPRHAKVIEAAKNIKPDIHIVYHSDGNPEAIYSELIDIGINVLNPVQPECMDPAMVKIKYGSRAAFLGAIGVQHTIPFGSVEDIRNEVKLRMQTIGKNGGYILSPAHSFSPEVPWENMKALYDAVDEFGNY